MRIGRSTAILRAVTTDDLLVGLDEILAARERIAGHVHRTPLLSSATAARFVAAAGGPRLADGRLYLKAEHLQKTGSFKARGMTNRIATLDAEQRARGAITMSAGNAGQAYAWAATRGRRADDGRDGRRRQPDRRSRPAAATAPRSSSRAPTSARRSGPSSGSATSAA